MSALSPARTIAELKELRALTSDDAGAQRVAFTQVWREARAWLLSKVAGLPVKTRTDAAGNLWITLPGERPESLLIGGHMDSVPNGGWLDGCLNVLAGIEILRRIHAESGGHPPCTVHVVDWADEEGARFGKSLFGSSAFAGTLAMEEARRLEDHDGVPLPSALAENGIDFDRVLESAATRPDAKAYIELHIEQGPVLLEKNLSLAAVVGTVGVERHALTFRGQAAHSGSTPMASRRDAFLAAARMAPEVYRIAERHGGVCTIGSCTTKPGIVTSVVAECTLTLDQRHIDAGALSAMLAEAREASLAFAAETRTDVAWQRIWQIEPIPFDPSLIDLCEQAVRETCGVSHRMPSGPLHDAAEVSRSGIPTVMMFVQSLHGISHNKIEDTREEDLERAVRAFDRLASLAITHRVLA